MLRLPLTEHFKLRREFLLQLVVLTVGLHGVFIISTTLLEQLAIHSGRMSSSNLDVDVPLLIGLGLIYLSTLLRRRKRAAWVIALLAYIFMIGFYANQTAAAFDHHAYLEVVRKFIIPVLLIGLLWVYQSAFTVKSDIRSFRYSARVSLIVLLVALLYGTAGFILLDRYDFHQEITPGRAVERTLDQFGLTTSRDLVPSTRRAKLFVSSLSVVSVGAVGYMIISLFQPIRARYVSHTHDRERAEALLKSGIGKTGKSEDFFKLWPHDKLYFFDKNTRAGLAYKVRGGVALVVGDPFGDQEAASRLLREFRDLCYGNDWLPAFVHTEPDWSDFYRKHGLGLQKVGEEAVVDIAKFDAEVRGNKYFRQIRNRFEREKFTTELLLPPHDKAVVARLRTVSDDWLAQPGRSERSFLLGYFSEPYLQQCALLVARDAAGTIQAFINQVPSFDPKEANFDMLRHAADSPGNINDFLLMAFIDYARTEGFKRVNLGLAPLAGLHDIDDNSVVTRAMRFLYSNGDRFYSFSGLERFKAKYQPDWSDRFMAYPASTRNFVRVTNALNRAMRVKKISSSK